MGMPCLSLRLIHPASLFSRIGTSFNNNVCFKPPKTRALALSLSRVWACQPLKYAAASGVAEEP